VLVERGRGDRGGSTMQKVGRTEGGGSCSSVIEVVYNLSEKEGTKLSEIKVRDPRKGFQKGVQKGGKKGRLEPQEDFQEKRKGGP